MCNNPEKATGTHTHTYMHAKTGTENRRNEEMSSSYLKIEALHLYKHFTVHFRSCISSNIEIIHFASHTLSSCGFPWMAPILFCLQRNEQQLKWDFKRLLSHFMSSHQLSWAQFSLSGELHGMFSLRMPSRHMTFPRKSQGKCSREQLLQNSCHPDLSIFKVTSTMTQMWLLYFGLVTFRWVLCADEVRLGIKIKS